MHKPEDRKSVPHGVLMKQLVKSWLLYLMNKDIYLDSLVADKLGCQMHFLHTLLPRELEEGWSSVCLWSGLPDHTSRNTGHSTETSLPILHQLI